MEVALDLTSYAHALGRAQAAWRFACPSLRRAAALATVSAAWDTFRRDAGPGAIGPAHEPIRRATELLLCDDPRRDGMLLWLADYGTPVIAEAASTVSRMVGATARFDSDDQALLDAARGVLTDASHTAGALTRLIAGRARLDDPVLQPLRTVATAVDRLRTDIGFAEGEGAEVRYALPRGTLSHYRPADPAGCWALNLALLATKVQTATEFLPPALASRELFRNDLEQDEIAARLVGCAAAGWSGIYELLLRLQPELARGRDALAHLSRNARTPDAWLLVAAVGACTRTHLARALGLSRAGADIQARTLADAELVSLGVGGQIVWTRVKKDKDSVPARLANGPLSGAISDVDASLAEIDRLLARTARQ